MTNESDSNDPQPSDVFFDAPDRSGVEEHLKRLQPHMPQVDYQRLDALLTTSRQIDAVMPPLSAGPISGRAWGAIAAAWCFGVTFGVLVTLMVHESRQPQQIAAKTPATVDPGDSRQASRTAPETVAAAVDDSKPRRVEASSSAGDDASRFVQRSTVDDAVWQATLFEDHLRVGTHLYTTTTLAAPSAHSESASDVKGREWPEALHEPDQQSAPPASALQRPTPRRLLDALLNDGSSNIL